MEEKHLDKIGLTFFWSKLKTMLAGKQDKLTGTAGQIVGFDADGNPVAENGAKSTAFTITLMAADWADNAQTVNDIQFLTENYSYIVAPSPANFAAYGEAGIYAEDVTTNGQMVFHCDSAPDAALSVNIVRVVSTE